MKKLFEAEYPEDLISQFEKYVRETMYNEDGDTKVFRPFVVVEFFDQNGDELINK